jgi:uncharacterized membrane protein
MEGNHTRGVASKAAIAGHPIHPMLVPFPIAFLVGALLTDLAYWGSGDPFWARASLWLVGAGLVMGIAAALVGAVDFATIPRARAARDGWIHALGNTIVLLLALISLVLRSDDPADAVLPWGLLLSMIIAGVLVVTGWFGGELAYRHLIGMNPHEEYRP